MCESSVSKPSDVLKTINTIQGSSIDKNDDLENVEEAGTTDSEDYVSESLR